VCAVVKPGRCENLFRLIGGRPNLPDSAAIALVWTVASSETGDGVGCLLWVCLWIHCVSRHFRGACDDDDDAMNKIRNINKT
jgi:hypothetical protein